MPPPSTVSGDQSSQMNTATRKIPIVVVPGIMGSRLSDPVTHALVWNPDGAPVGRSPGSAFGASLVGMAQRLQQLSNPLVGDNWHTSGYRADLAEQAANIKHFYELIPDSYDALCFGLDKVVTKLFKASDKNKTLEASVWGCGYDWRQNNVFSASTLAARVVEARAACNDEKVILVAHSMGGLVSRLYCRLGGEAAVRALFLIASPSLGATLPYAYLKRGLVASDGEMMAIRLAFLHEFSQASSREFTRSMPSLWQLMPSPQFARLHPDWLAFEREQTGYPWTHTPGVDDIQKKLGDAIDPLAVITDLYLGLMERAAPRGLYSLYASWHALQYGLLTAGDGVYMPPNTYILHCNDLDTPTTAYLPEYGGVEVDGNNNEYVPRIDYTQAGQAVMTWRPDLPRIEAPLELHNTGGGDESVPSWSANPPSVSNPFVQVDAISGVNHGKLPNDGQVLALIAGYIAGMSFDP